MNAEMIPATIVRELVATEIHRRRLLRMLEQMVGREITDPAVFGYSHLITSETGEQGFGEGFNLSDKDVETLLNAAIERGR